MPENIIQVFKYAGVIAGAVFFTAMASFSIVSVFEKEYRAAGRSFMAALIIPAPYILLSVLKFEYQGIMLPGLIVITVILFVLLLLPIRFGKIDISEFPNVRIDERDIMFSRRLLEPGTKKYDEYYKLRPENKEADELFRANPGLLKKGSSLYNTFQFKAADASFNTVAAFHPILEREPAKEKSEVDAEKAGRFIKGWAKKLGAVSIGFSELQDYHKYSVIGRGADYGREVKLNHKFAIALTVEMDKQMVDTAPHGPTAMESAQQYVNAGTIAVQLAEFILGLGFSARAHIDGNYRVVCPLIAKDAGLGEIGRMGLLMTPELGPRVRIAAVTTDLPLIPDKRVKDDSVHEFCQRCQKCADVCPSQAVSFDGPMEIEGAVRWQIDQEKCFTYWTICGTDCGRCMSVCPYSHPNTLLHNIIRRGLKNSSLFQIFALKLDDFFYGRKPAPKMPGGYLELDC